MPAADTPSQRFDINAVLRQAVTAHQSGNFDKAAKLYRKVLDIDADHPEAIHNLGLIAYHNRDLQKARGLIEQSVSLRPGEAAFHNNLGNILKDLEQYGAAAASYQKALKRDPQNPAIHNNLGVIVQGRGDHVSAIDAFTKALKLAPRYAEALNNRGLSHLACKNIGKALADFGKAVEINPGYSNALNNLGDALRDQGRLAQARANFEKSIATQPGFDAYMGLGRTLVELDDTASALAAFQHGLEIDPSSTQALVSIGGIHALTNNSDEARTFYRRALAINPGYSPALLGLSQQNPQDGDIKLIQQTHQTSTPHTLTRAYAAMALGIIEERAQNYKTAFTFYLEGNAARRASFDYAVDETRQRLNSVTAVFDRLYINKRLGEGHADATPIFILGMPRSGTSLVEQILASHPAVHGAGERTYFQTILQVAGLLDNKAAPKRTPISALNATDLKLIGAEYIKFLRQHSATAPHVTDKLPANFWHIGLIKLALPNAKIIYCRRDPVDNCLSIFKNFFEPVHQYAHNLQELAHYSRSQAALMAHWHTVLPDNAIHTVQYEDLITDPETMIRSLLDYCALDFHPDCVNFHESRRVVRTASYQQIHKPIYATSMNTADRYGNDVKPLIDALKADTL